MEMDLAIATTTIINAICLIALVTMVYFKGFVDGKKKK